MNAIQLNETEAKAAEWFIARFLPTDTTRNFCRQYNGLLDRDRKIDARTEKANARYQITFQQAHQPNCVIVQARHKDALWAIGTIALIENKRGKRFVFESDSVA